MNTAHSYINPYLNLTVEQQVTINHLHKLLNGSGISAESVFAVMFIPIGYSLNLGIFPGAYIAWFTLGLGIYDWIYHLFKYELKLIRSWRWFNLLYFLQRYCGTGMIITGTFWSITGHTGNCKNYYYSIFFFAATSIAACQIIFLTRVGILTRWNKYFVGLLVFFAIGSFSCVVWGNMTDVGLNPPKYLPVIFCETYVKSKTPFMFSAFFIAFFDILVFIITLWSLRGLFKRGEFLSLDREFKQANLLRFIILRDNIVYIIVVTSADIVSTSMLFYHPQQSYFMMVVPFSACVHIIFGCRVFIQLKFYADQFNGTCVAEEATRNYTRGGELRYDFGFTDFRPDIGTAIQLTTISTKYSPGIMKESDLSPLRSKTFHLAF